MKVIGLFPSGSSVDAFPRRLGSPWSMRPGIEGRTSARTIFLWRIASPRRLLRVLLDRYTTLDCLFSGIFLNPLLRRNRYLTMHSESLSKCAEYVKSTSCTFHNESQSGVRKTLNAPSSICCQLSQNEILGLLTDLNELVANDETVGLRLLALTEARKAA